MSKHLVDIDDDLLGEAKKILGSTTMKETVNWSLGEIVASEQRRQHANRLFTMTGLELDDPAVMSRAWR